MPIPMPRLISSLIGLLLLCVPQIGRAQPMPPAKAPAPPPPADRVLQVVDALGQPIVGADVTLTLRLHAEQESGGIPGENRDATSVVSHLKTNEGAWVSLPGAERADGTVEVSHADWGLARAELSGPGAVSGATLVLPLVKHDAPAYARALKGLVLGPDHRPVEGATVRCGYVRTPGEGLISSSTTASVVSDRDGHFSLYVPDGSLPRPGILGDDGDRDGKKKLPERGDLIPANSRFSIAVDVPGDGGFFPYVGDHPNLDEAVIRLKRPAKSRTFAYESPAGGFITDVAVLRNVRLWYAPPKGQAAGGRFALPPRYAVGGKLAAGTYLAELDKLHFLPVEVGEVVEAGEAVKAVDAKDDSPADLVFRLAPPITYRGRVVSGVTGKPMAGAFVLAMNGTGDGNLALLDPAAWQRLHDLPAAPPTDSPALEPVRRTYTFDGIVRTDDQGRFELTRKRGIEPAYGLIFFEQDFLPIMHRLYATQPDERNQAAVRDVPLYPAARVVVRAVFKNPGSVSVSPRWEPAPRGQPEWFGAFRAAADGGERQFQYDQWLKLNEKQPVFVPAGLTMSVLMETPYNDEWSAADTGEVFRLEAGATKDLGDIQFEASLAVTVRVVNESGRPVEGAPVRRLDARQNSWCVAHNSDAEGKVRFYVRPRSTGQLGIIDLPGLAAPNPPVNLMCPYRVGGKEDAETPFTIRMTREQVEVLSGPKPREL